MFSNKLFWLSMAFLLLVHDGVQTEECCTEKMVGDVSYSLLSEDFNGPLPPQCLNDCVYTKTGMLSPKFCFARGDLQTECSSEIFAETQSSGCITEVNYDYIGNDLCAAVISSGTQDCANKCKQCLGCLFWTYRKSDGSCFTKSTKTGRKKKAGFVSGNVACANGADIEAPPAYADQYRGCCSWKNITGSMDQDGFYIVSDPREDSPDDCQGGCTYTKVDKDLKQYCLPAISTDDAVAECDSCNECKETDLIGSSGCGEFAGKILGFLATCTARCIFSFDVGCIVGCITDLLVDAGLPAAAIDCVCQVIPGNLC